MSTLIGQATGPVEIGVTGESTQFEGVRGIGHAENHGAVVGINDSSGDGAGPGVYGESSKGEGVRGISHSAVHGAVVGTCDNEAPGIFGESSKGEGVRGVGHSAAHGAVVGTNENPSGVGIFGKGGRLAGQFEGDVEISGGLKVHGVQIVPEQNDKLDRQVAVLQQQVTTLQQQLPGLQQLVNNLQSQLASLQSKEAADVQGISVSLATLAARVTSLGG
jgi:hypothetical protein